MNANLLSKLPARTFMVLIAPIALLLIMPSPAGAFKWYVHRDITQETLQPLSVNLPVAEPAVHFSDKAIDQIISANKWTDLFEWFDPAAHSDSESFAGASTRVKLFKQQIVDLVTAPTAANGEEARKLLGRSLHTIQDFYSHSNWIEWQGTGSIKSEFGTDVFSGVGDDVFTCDPLTKRYNGLNGLTSGYAGSTINFLPAIPIFDFPYVRPRLFASDYYIDIPLRKVAHSSFGCPEGIDKDDDSRDRYFGARGSAKAATLYFVNQIISAIRVRPGLTNNQVARAIKVLLGVHGTLGMVIDTTGSMGPYIAGVQRQVARIVSDVRTSDEAPEQYLLVTFGDNNGDPNITQLSTSDPDVLLARVNTLVPSGGGDCPEFSQAGLRAAIAASRVYSELHLFTDASSKDSADSAGVIAAAQEKGIKLNYPLFGSCSPIDPAYIAGAAQTGGQLFLLSASDVDRYFDLIRPSLTGDLVALLTSSQIMNGTPKDYTLPIDSSVRNMVVSVSGDTAPTLTLFRPSGASVVSGDPGVTFTNVSFGRLITVSAPVSGNWRLRVQNSGSTSVEVKVNSALQLSDFSFVEHVSPGVHPVLAKITGQPLVGATLTGSAHVVGPYSNTNFRLVDEAGETLQSLSVTVGTPETGSNDFIFPVALPIQPFRVAVSGLDAGGLAYQRIFPNLYRGQTAGVKVDPADTQTVLVAGKTSRISFVVNNVGSTGTFGITARDNMGFVKAVSPTTVALATGGSSTINVDVVVPSTTPNGTSVSITATATNKANSAVTNSAIRTLSVLTRDIADVNADGIVNIADLEALRFRMGAKRGSERYTAFADTDNNGIIDVRDLAFVARRIK